MKLTSKHIELIEEMAKKFYPKKKVLVSYSDIESVILEDGDLRWPEAFKFIWVIDKKKDEFFVYPWFEFCIDKLVKKIAKFDKYNYVSLLGDMFHAYHFSKTHPVDYLYRKSL